MTTQRSHAHAIATTFDGLVLAERDGGGGRVKVLRRFGSGGGGGDHNTNGPLMSPLWWVIAAYFGSNILSGVHGSTGMGFMTGNQRAVVGIALMGIYMGLVAVAVSLMKSLRD